MNITLTQLVEFCSVLILLNWTLNTKNIANEILSNGPRSFPWCKCVNVFVRGLYWQVFITERGKLIIFPINAFFNDFLSFLWIPLTLTLTLERHSCVNQWECSGLLCVF